MLKKMLGFIFGERLQSHLPERVRESIVQQQCESEKFISRVQLLLVVTFEILYALAPSSVSEVRVQPVPWILSAYFIFTMVCLIGSHRGQLPNWLLMASW
jgi:adenylate cyclase